MTPPRKGMLRLSAAGVLVRLSELAARVIPPETLRRTGELFGAAYWHLFPRRRRLALANVKIAFGENASPRRLRSIVYRSFRHFGRFAADFLLAGRLEPAAVRRRVHVRQEEWRALVAAARKGNGVVLVMAHLGNWEPVSALLVGAGARVSAVYRPQRVGAADRVVRRTRVRLGSRLISRPMPIRLRLAGGNVHLRDESFQRKVLGRLKAGDVVVFLADQHAHRSGVVVNFFGRSASTARGPFVYARRAGARVFFAVTPVLPGGVVDFRVCEFPLSQSGGLRAALREDCRRLNRLYEAAVRAWPAQWVWAHNRWGVKW